MKQLRISATLGLKEKIQKHGGIGFISETSRLLTVTTRAHAELWILMLLVVDNDTAWRMIEDLHYRYQDHIETQPIEDNL